MTISSEDFAIWRAQPITEAVYRYVAAYIEEMKDQWHAASWEVGEANPLLLAECRGIAAMCKNILELTAKELNEESNDLAAG